MEFPSTLQTMPLLAAIWTMPAVPGLVKSSGEVLWVFLAMSLYLLLPTCLEAREIPLFLLETIVLDLASKKNCSSGLFCLLLRPTLPFWT